MPFLNKFAITGSVALAVFLAACSSGSDGGGGPVTVAEAVSQENDVVAELRVLFTEMTLAENAAHEALDAQDYAEWNRYWREDYPDWVARLEAAAARFASGEDALLARLGEQSGESKAIPLPIVILAVATITTIAIMERERLAAMDDPPTQSETDAAIDRRAAYLESQGLNQTQARTRATVDIGELETLKGLKNGIEHARDFVVEQVPNFLAGYLPETLSNALDIVDTGGKLNQINDNVDVLLSSDGCDTEGQNQRKADFDDGFVDNFPVCRVNFCDGSDGSCSDVAADDWNVAVFAPELVRDEVPVTVADGSQAVAELTLTDTAEFDPPDEPAGGSGAYDIVGYGNFDGSSGTDPAAADIQISGDDGFPTFSWSREGTIQILVFEDENSLLYGIYASEEIENDPETSEDDETVPLPSTIRYGDYSVPNSQPISNAQMPSPAFVVGQTYIVSVAIETGPDSGEAASLSFTRTR